MAGSFVGWLGKKVNAFCYLCSEDNVMTAQPAPKTQELAEKIDSFFDIKRKPSEFNIRLLKRDARKLNGKIEYSDYYSLLGLIASLENDKVNIINYYEEAIKSSPNDYQTYHNYVVSLSQRGFLKEEFQQSKFVIEKFPNRQEALENHIYVVSRSCRFRDYVQLTEKLNTSSLSSLHKDRSFHEEITKAIAIFENSQLSDNEAQDLCQLAFSVLEIKNLYFSASEINIVDDCVCYTIHIDSPIEDIADINWELAGVFAENVEDMRSDVLMFEYSSIDVLEERESYERSI
jgi:hypothetical protein